MPFDTLNDLMPVASLASNDFVLSVNPSVSVKTFAEFIDFAQKANRPLPYALGGNGSSINLRWKRSRNAPASRLPIYRSGEAHQQRLPR